MPDTDATAEPLHELASRAWAVCLEARPSGLLHRRVGVTLAVWTHAPSDRDWTDEEARAAIVAQGMACIFAWPAYERDAALNLIYEHGHLVPLAERVCGAIVVMAPSVPLPRPKPVEV